MTGPLVPGTPLDVSVFPTTYEYTGTNGTTVELADMILDMKYMIELLAQLGVIRDTIGSFGFAVSFLEPHELENLYDDPGSFVGIVGGWGDEQHRYIANAIRKMRASARTGSDTLEMVEAGAKLDFDLFTDRVESEVKGAFPWGDFAHGGAAFVSFGDRTMLVAASFVTAEQDDLVAGFIGKLYGKAMYLADKPA